MSERTVNVPLLAGGLLTIFAIVALLSVGFTLDPTKLEDRVTGRPAPGFTLVDLDGKTTTLADHAGKPVVINFWSTWCLPCKQEHPVLLEAAERYPDVKFFGVLYNDHPKKASKYLNEVGSNYPHLIDPNSRTAIDYAVTGVPETYFIDREGRIVEKVPWPLGRRDLYPRLEALLGS
jgi:cytochrome c biogenesis protein CcmG/thiol:disulfide interchange protein DsbE